jgi:hypothetical protein
MNRLDGCVLNIIPIDTFIPRSQTLSLSENSKNCFLIPAEASFRTDPEVLTPLVESVFGLKNSRRMRGNFDACQGNFLSR